MSIESRVRCCGDRGERARARGGRDRGDVGAALDDFNDALEIDPALGEAYLNRGNSYYLMQRFDDALTDYRQALDLELSKPWTAWYNIGLAHDAINNR